jgi:hypothetical protein
MAPKSGREKSVRVRAADGAAAQDHGTRTTGMDAYRWQARGSGRSVPASLPGVDLYSTFSWIVHAGRYVGEGLPDEPFVQRV